MEWKNPNAFLLLILLAGAIVWFFIHRKKSTAALQISTTSLMKSIPKGWRARWVELPQFLKVLGLILLLMALARPQQPNTKIKRNVEGIDIVIALDVSDSMLIEDMKPLNRLESAKETIKKFVEQRTSDRIG